MTPHELKQERLRLRCNIGQMAMKFGTPRGTYLKWERGERRIPGILVVALDFLRNKKKIIDGLCVIDHRKLLIKYIGLIGDCEGIDFIFEANPNNFTEEEIKELKKCSEESNT